MIFTVCYVNVDLQTLPPASQSKSEMVIKGGSCNKENNTILNVYSLWVIWVVEGETFISCPSPFIKMKWLFGKIGSKHMLQAQMAQLWEIMRISLGGQSAEC